MTRLADMEKQIVDEYEELKGKAVGEFNKNLVSHLFGVEKFKLFNDLDYGIAHCRFGEVKVQRQSRGRFWQTVTRPYEAQEEVQVEEHLIVGAMPRTYERRSCSFMLDLTLEVFKELGLTAMITGDAHVLEVKRHNNLNVYVLDQESGLTVQVMDDSVPPQRELLKVPWHVRYSTKFREKEKSLPAEEFRKYWQELADEYSFSPLPQEALAKTNADHFALFQSDEILKRHYRSNFAPIFRYHVGNEALAVKAMLLYGARNIMNIMTGLQHDFQSKDAPPEHKELCESTLPILEERLAEIRKLPTQ